MDEVSTFGHLTCLPSPSCMTALAEVLSFHVDCPSTTPKLAPIHSIRPHLHSNLTRSPKWVPFKALKVRRPFPLTRYQLSYSSRSGISQLRTGDGPQDSPLSKQSNVEFSFTVRREPGTGNTIAEMTLSCQYQGCQKCSGPAINPGSPSMIR